MVNVYDVASYILKKRGEMTTMKLQKLVYYSLAWSTVWHEKPLFTDRIEAWASGPVAPRLFIAHKGLFNVNESTFKDIGNDSKLTRKQKETINVVLNAYGDKTPGSLIQLTHQETPWRKARKGIRKGERCNNEITRAAMAEYYGTLYNN